MRSQTTANRELIKDDDTEKTLMVVGLDVDRYRWTLVASDARRTTNPRRVRPGDVEQLEERIDEAADRLGITGAYEVVCCYEAGRDGFWIYRKLRREGWPCEVVDPGSLPESKKGRRAKTDRTDAERLAQEFGLYLEGLEERISVVRVPEPKDEDLRENFREMKDLKHKRNAVCNQIRDLLAKHGIEEYPTPPGPEFVEWLEEAETAYGEDVGEYLCQRLKRAAQQLWLYEKHLEDNEQDRQEYLSEKGRDEIVGKVRRATMLRGIGVMTAWGLVTEMFGWREFNNRRELSAYVGVDGRRHDSGGDANDQGITRQGNGRVRTLAIQLARNWLRWQADSELSQWARARFGDEDGSVSQTGVVALARKLLNRIRVFVNGGEPPWGARVREPKI